MTSLSTEPSKCDHVRTGPLSPIVARSDSANARFGYGSLSFNHSGRPIQGDFDGSSGGVAWSGCAVARCVECGAFRFSRWIEVEGDDGRQ
jgi:hypothetical protein